MKRTNKKTQLDHPHFVTVYYKSGAVNVFVFHYEDDLFEFVDEMKNSEVCNRISTHVGMYGFITVC